MTAEKLAGLVVWLDIASEVCGHVASDIEVDLGFSLHLTLD